MAKKTSRGKLRETKRQARTVANRNSPVKVTDSAGEQSVAFLFGAGASAEAGVCTSEKITETLLNYGSYCPSEGSTEIENILKYIQVRIGDYLGIRASEVNFEFLLGTLMELSEREHLPVVPLLGEGDLLVKKLEQKLPLSKVLDKLYALFRELLFITGAVDYLFPLKTFLDLTKPLDMFTLNYDLSLETAFDVLKLRYVTGYREREKELATWDPSQFNAASLDVRIFKLHGSINWGSFYGYPPVEEGRSFEATEQAKRYIANYTKRVQFAAYPIASVEPPGRTTGMVGAMNFGTRKEQLYASSQFTTLFNFFLTALHSVKTLVIAGYSFQDRAINKLVEESTLEREGNLHLIVVNPSMYWIEQQYPVLREFVNLGWVSRIEKPLGEALSTGSIRDAVTASVGSKRKARSYHATAPVNQGSSEQVPV